MLKENAAVVRFEHVSKQYITDGEPVPALQDVSLAFARGEFVALAGRSGCGKSTLLNLAGAMDFPTSGTVTLDGVVTSSLNDAGLARLRREKVGFVFQSFQLLPTLSVVENVELPLLLAGRGAARTAALEKLRRVEMDAYAARMPYQLSGGQMQRVAIARALVHDPTVLLADEPTGNLDTATGDVILALLREIADREGATILMATHSPEAAAISDRLVRMRNGRVEEIRELCQNLILFYRLILRPLRREPVRASLTAAAVALGVAVVLAIELAGGAAAGSFRASVESLTGTADFEITATGGVPATVLGRIEALPYAFRSRPRIEDYAEIAGANRTVPLIGVDLLSDALPGTAESGSANEFQQDDSVWVGDGLGYKPGDALKLLVNDASGEYVVRGVLEKGSGAVIVMDLAPATRVLRRNGSLDRILVQAPPGRSIDEWETVLRAALPPGVMLARQGARTNENRRMLRAFRWNLRVLSYIALVVGAFLIYNTISVSVVRRRAEIGVVRALGAQRSQVLAAFLGEAACFGLLGGVAGIGLGRLMAVGALKLVASTVESLYVSSTPGPIALTWGLALLACLIGIAVAVGSALAPAWEAGRVAPVEAMARGRREHQVRLHKTRGLLLAAVLGGAAWLASRQPAWHGEPVFGYAAAVLLIAASTLLLPALVSGLATTSARPLGLLFGVEAMLASRSLAGSLRRTSVLVGALSTAIAMMVAVAIMVGSFRETVLVWMGDRLQADLYLRPAVPQATDRHPTMSPEVLERLRQVPQVAAIDPFRAYDISYQGWPAILGAGDSVVAAKYSRRPFLSGEDPRKETQQLTSGDNAIVSEPFASKHGVQRGDVLDLSLAGRPVRFTVVGIYYDYSSERGYIIVDRSTLLKYLPDPAPSNVAVYLKPGVPVEQGRRAVEAALAGRRVLAFSNRTLREEAIRIFDRTFAITYALEAIAVFVAVMGIAGALLALVIDRRREFGLLRFLGGAAGQLRRIILFEAGLLGLLSNVAGLILGFFLSLLLIYVINKQSFGWTFQFHWPTAMLLGALTLVYAATVIAGLYPARLATRLNPIEVVHEE